MRSLCVLLLLSLLFSIWPQAASGDEITELLDGTKIVGTLVHYYDGVLSLKLPNGNTLQLPAGKVRQIQFKLPKPRPALSTPQKTFQRMRQAALKGDLDIYIDSHSTYYQMILNHQVSIATAKKFKKRLKEEMGNMQLEVLETKINGSTAVMKIRQRKGDQSQEGEARFVKENGEWKMILPL